MTMYERAIVLVGPLLVLAPHDTLLMAIVQGVLQLWASKNEQDMLSLKDSSLFAHTSRSWACCKVHVVFRASFAASGLSQHFRQNHYSTRQFIKPFELNREAPTPGETPSSHVSQV